MEKIKLLIVDDSPVIRDIIKEMLSRDDQIEVIGEAEDPLDAREKIKQLNPDLITLDVEMPKMDGITFLKNLMRLRPMPVIMVSTLTTKGADTTLEALEIGAIDFIGKPSVESLLSDKEQFQSILIEKIKSVAQVGNQQYRLTADSQKLAAKQASSVLEFPGQANHHHLIAIGASTGGTEAIRSLIKKLPQNCPPVVITLHIPDQFSQRFASRLNKQVTVEVVQAQHGQKLAPGHVYVAPGDRHLVIAKKKGALFTLLDDSEPVNRHKPAVDVLFKSLIPIANNVQAVLLTGMGRDGAEGMLALKDSGSRTIIQDKQSSLIWGMPGAAHRIGAHQVECPLHEIAEKLLVFAAQGRHQTQEGSNE